MKGITGFLLMVALAGGCVSAQKHYKEAHGEYEREITVGTVQKEIRLGMSGAEVATALGSPNIVTTDEKGREVWIYDKISTDVSYSRSDSFGTLLLIGGTKEAGARSTTQKTLTVVIKFDDSGKVRDFAYHSSRF